MLSINKKFLFIHLPKTAGNSIQERIKAHSEDEIVCINDIQDGIERFEVRNNYEGLHKHSSLADYKNALPLDLFNQLFVFTTIRSPWDRMISYYFSPHRKVTEWNRSDFIKLVTQAKKLSELLKLGNESDDEAFENASFILRFESIEEDFKTLTEKLGIGYLPLNQRNRSQRSGFKQYYDDELRDMVAEKFAAEIRYGQYEF